MIEGKSYIRVSWDFWSWQFLIKIAVKLKIPLIMLISVYFVESSVYYFKFVNSLLNTAKQSKIKELNVSNKVR